MLARALALLLALGMVMAGYNCAGPGLIWRDRSGGSKSTSQLPGSETVEGKPRFPATKYLATEGKFRSSTGTSKNNRMTGSEDGRTRLYVVSRWRKVADSRSRESDVQMDLAYDVLGT